MALIADLARAEAELQRAVGPNVRSVMDDNGGIHLLRSAQDALRSSHACLAQAQRVAKIGSWELELLDGLAIGAVTWSDEMYHMLGYEPEAVPATAEGFLAHVPEHERAKVLSAISDCARGDGTYLVQHHLRSADGRERVVLERGAIVRDGAGRAIRLCGTCQDITEKDNANRILAATEDRNRRLLDAIQAGVVVHRLDGSVATFNATACRLFGGDPALLHRKQSNGTDWTFLRPDGTQLPDVEFPVNAVRHTGVPVRGQILGIPQAAGEIGWFQADADPVSDPGTKRMVEVIVTFMDISERVRAERNLREIVGNLPGFIYRCKNTPEWPVEFVSAGVQETLGYAPHEFSSGQISFAAIIMPEERQRLWDEVQQALSARRRYQFEYRARRKDGRVCWLWERGGGVFDQTGALLHLEGIISDVTEKKELEDQFRQAQKMDALGHLCGGVAHDFNNLITVIKGHIGLVETTEKLPTSLVESLNQIAEAADRAANLTRQLLAFSRKEVMSSRTVNFVAGIQAMTKMLRRMVGENYPLTLNLPDQPLWVHADPGMLDQVLLNLVINARDAMPKGGSIEISVGACTLTKALLPGHPSRRAGEFVALYVKDHGIGIEPEILPRIFEPFFTTKPANRGTGLGLATVFGIVGQHHGWIEVDAGLGQGAEFRVYLPRHDTSAAIDSPELRQAPGGTETILLVEDEHDVRVVIESVLLRRGYRVVSVRTGAEALAYIQDPEQPIDLMITDIVLTEATTGADLYRAGLTIRPDLRVIFISGYAPDHVTRDMKLHEGVNFLPKPFTPEALLRCVRRRLEARGSVSPFLAAN